MKRVFDVALAALLAPVALPLVLIALVLIRLESRGAPLFRQTRIGRFEAPFQILKLRTMYADTADVPSHEARTDQITRVGRWLRRSKLDELPQIWCVLAGTMSFVGPRPCLPSQKSLIDARRALGVHRLRPGVTGIAQLKGIDMSTPDLLAATDALYLNRQSLIHDMDILIRTALGRGFGDAVRRTPESPV